MLEQLLKTWDIQPDQVMAFGIESPKIKGVGTITVNNPSTAKAIYTAQYAKPTTHANIVKAASIAQKQWAKVPAPKRGQLIFELGLLLRQHQKDLALAISYEVGKTLKESMGEVQEMIDMADMALGQSRMLNGLTMHSERSEHRMYEQWHPLGIVAVITAFNFPAAVWAWNAMLAVIAGNVVLWKPSPKAVLTSIIVHKICEQAMAKVGASGVFYLSLLENEQVLPLLAAEPRIPLVSFTGSTAVGRLVATTVAQRLGKSLLELSGNNASIVCQSANLAQVIPAVVFAAVGTSGQRCTTLRRLYVEQSIYHEVIERLTTAYQKLRIGDPWQETTLLGPLIDAQALKSFTDTVATINDLGGTIYAGGKKLARPGYFVEPTIVAAEPYWPIIQKEIFAPILYVMPFTNLTEAIALQNASKHGLSSSIFTENLKEMEQFLSCSGSDCGIANVNMGPSGAEIGGAFGGEKDTGGGREAGSDAWKAYMRRQTCTINYSNELPLAQGIEFE